MTTPSSTDPASTAPARARAIRSIPHHPTRLIETSLGPVQVAVSGSGPAVLSLHGAPGGWDQALLLGEPFRAAGFTVIAPARPGYQGTPLDSGRTMAQQAQLLAEILDSLGVERATVLAHSCGGLPLYTFAATFPQRVAALIPVAAVSKGFAYSKPMWEQLLEVSPVIPFMVDAVESVSAAAAVEVFLGVESNASDADLARLAATIVADPALLAAFDVCSHTIADGKTADRSVGYVNDMEQFKLSDQLDLRGISAPTLVIQARDDKELDPALSEFAAATIAGAELYWQPLGGHTAIFFSDTAEATQHHAVAWLQRILAG